MKTKITKITKQASTLTGLITSGVLLASSLSGCSLSQYGPYGEDSESSTGDSSSIEEVDTDIDSSDGSSSDDTFGNYDIADESTTSDTDSDTVKSDEDDEALSDVEISLDEVTDLLKGKANFAKHTYKAFAADCTWDEAKENCERLGGHLATIQSSDELYDMMETLWDNRDIHVFYVGGVSERDHGARWQLNGDEDNLVPVSSDMSDSWMDNEPSFEGKDEKGAKVTEDRLALFAGANIYDDYKLNDVPSDILAAAPSYEGIVGYVCEFGDDEHIYDTENKCSEYDNYAYAYEDIVQTIDSDTSGLMYDLQYIDGDKLPELVISSSDANYVLYFSYGKVFIETSDKILGKAKSAETSALDIIDQVQDLHDTAAYLSTDNKDYSPFIDDGARVIIDDNWILLESYFETELNAGDTYSYEELAKLVMDDKQWEELILGSDHIRYVDSGHTGDKALELTFTGESDSGINDEFITHILIKKRGTDYYLTSIWEEWSRSEADLSDEGIYSSGGSSGADDHSSEWGYVDDEGYLRIVLKDRYMGGENLNGLYYDAGADYEDSVGGGPEDLICHVTEIVGGEKYFSFYETNHYKYPTDKASLDYIEACKTAYGITITPEEEVNKIVSDLITELGY